MVSNNSKKFVGQYIQNAKARYSSFSKRKSGMFSKARQLSETTGGSVLLLLESQGGHFYWQATGPQSTDLEKISSKLIEEHRTCTSFIHGETRGDEKTPGNLTNHLSVRAKRRLNRLKREQKDHRILKDPDEAHEQVSSSGSESSDIWVELGNDSNTSNTQPHTVHTPPPTPTSESVTNSTSRPAEQSYYPLTLASSVIHAALSDNPVRSIRAALIESDQESSTDDDYSPEPAQQPHAIQTKFSTSSIRSRFVQHPHLHQAKEQPTKNGHSGASVEDFGFEVLAPGQSLMDFLPDMDNENLLDKDDVEARYANASAQEQRLLLNYLSPAAPSPHGFHEDPEEGEAHLRTLMAFLSSSEAHGGMSPR